MFHLALFCTFVRRVPARLQITALAHRAESGRAFANVTLALFRTLVSTLAAMFRNVTLALFCRFHTAEPSPHPRARPLSPAYSLFKEHRNIRPRTAERCWPPYIPPC